MVTIRLFAVIYPFTLPLACNVSSLSITFVTWNEEMHLIDRDT